MIPGEKPTEIILLRDPKSLSALSFWVFSVGRAMCAGGEGEGCSCDPLNVECSAFIYIEGTGVSES